MRRYFEIYGIMMRNSLIREMSFKANFVLWMLVEVLWFCGQIFFFGIIFGQVDRIGDWTKWEVVLLVGTHQMIAQLFQAFFFVNLSNIPELVRTGKLDSLLVLPLDSQFAVSTKQFSLDSVINGLLGGVVVLVSLSRLRDRAQRHIGGDVSRRARLRRGSALLDHAQSRRGEFLDRARTGIGLRLLQFSQHRPISGCHFPAFVSFCFRLDHPRRYRSQYPGAASDQAAWAARMADVSPRHGGRNCLLAIADFLAFRPAALLKRKFVTSVKRGEKEADFSVHRNPLRASWKCP